MHVLVVYTQFKKEERRTHVDHLYSLQRYSEGNTVYYLNLRRPEDLLWMGFLKKVPFDAVILHYTFLSMRHNWPFWRTFYPQVKETLAALQGVKVMMPQDENNYTDDLRRLAKDTDVKLIFTVIRPEEHRLYYGEAIDAGARCHTVYTGYIDAAALAWVEQLAKTSGPRTIDIGYRARKLPYYYGRVGRCKTEIAERFNEILPAYPDIKADIDTTGDTQNVKMGDSWLRFLMNCRTMLGTLSGSSIMDADGRIIRAVDEYLQAHPQADFYEVEAACFAGVDGNTNFTMPGPRNFECVMTKTCQVLLEGDYGFLRPGKHYIEVKADYSNLREVMEKIRDTEYCSRMARQSYDDIIVAPGADNPYTYAWFARFVFGQIGEVAAEAGAVARRYAWGRFRRRYGLAQKRVRAGLAVKNAAGRAKGMLLNTYYALCRFAARHPRLRRLLGRPPVGQEESGEAEGS